MQSVVSLTADMLWIKPQFDTNFFVILKGCEIIAIVLFQID